MSDIASKLTTIAQKQQEVYDAGELKGYESGKQDEYDAFWGKFQNGGRRGDYKYAFYGPYWVDDIFKPKFDMYPEDASYMFDSSKMTRINKRICLSDHTSSAFAMFMDCDKLMTIQQLEFSAEREPPNCIESTVTMFIGCSALRNVSVSGVITTNLNFQSSPNLTVESALGIIDHLAYLMGSGGPVFGIGVSDVYSEDYTGECSIIFHNDVWERINALDEADRDGYHTWQEYISCELGWQT